MAKLILKYEAKVLREIPLTRPTITIGRTPDNDVVIDNPAVSTHHARFCFDGEKFNLEDLNSLNGTFVNQQPVRNTSLNNGDEILIGKHTLAYQDEGGVVATMKIRTEQPKALPKLEQTVVLDTQKQRELLQKARVAEGRFSPGPGAKVGSLIVLAGNTDQMEYSLTSKLTLIGKSPVASVKLKGWFAPDVAAVINKLEASYQIAPSGRGRRRTKLNGQPLAGPQDLQEGDLIEVAGVKLQFTILAPEGELRP